MDKIRCLLSESHGAIVKILTLAKVIDWFFSIRSKIGFFASHESKENVEEISLLDLVNYSSCSRDGSNLPSTLRNVEWDGKLPIVIRSFRDHGIN